MSCDTRHHKIRWKVRKIYFGLIVNFFALGLIFAISGMNRVEAAITFRAATSVNKQTSSASCTMSKPTGTIKDDVMIAAFQFAKGSSVTPPTGWNFIVRTDDTTNSMAVISYYKVAGASEPASYTWTLAPMSGWCTGGIHSYVGVSTSAPVDVSGGQSGTSNSPTTPSLTTTADSDWLIGVWAVWNGNLTINLPAGMTSRINFTGASPHRQADQSLGATGPTGTRVATTSTTAGSWIAQAITLKSAVPGSSSSFSLSGTVSPSASGSGTTLSLSGGSSTMVTADSTGTYSFSNLANGTYTITPSKAGYTFSPTSQPVTISGANVSGVNFTATPVPTWSMSGSVSPLPGASGTGLTLSGASSATATADSTGNYSFSNLANGTYTVTPSKAGYTFSPTSQPVTISGANVSGVNFTATPVPTWSMSGSVSPLPGASGTGLTLSGASSATATADSTGNYSFSNLANGTYTVTPSKAGYTFSPTSQPVTISGANVSGVNFTAQPLGAGINLVQKNTNGSETTIPTISAAFPSNNTQGNLLIVTGTAARPSATLSISDTAGNNYGVAIGPITESVQNVTAYVWYVQNCKGGPNTVTLTPSTPGALEIHISEYSGADPGSPLDQTSAGIGNGSNVSSGTRATTVNGELIFGYSFVGATSSSVGSGFTGLSYVNGDWDEYQIQGAAGNVAATFTQPNGPWLALMATFKPSGGNTTDAAQIGQWAAPFSSPIVMVNAVLMHTGKVLAFDDSGTHAQVWDPVVNSFTHVPNSVTDLFCSGQAALPDGRILVAGGHAAAVLGTNEANIFDPVTQTWITLPRMAYRRWYPTVTALPDGQMLVTAGDQTSATDFAPFPEVYDPSTNSWTTLTAANLPLPTYPHLFVLPSGKIVNTSTTEAAIPTRTLDVTTQTWAMVDARALDGASSVMYRLGLILKVGTASDSGPVRPSAATAYILDMNQPTPAWQQTASMHYPRATTTNLVVLPDGNVMVFGGGTNTSGYDATSQPIYAAEQWSPDTQTWRVMASQSKPRLYHAVALLLPDGRVLSSGSGRDTGVTDQLNGEIYSPPYLFKGPRPTITSVPNGAIAYGSSFLVGTPDPDIASIALIRPAAVTHGFDEDQRFVNLSFAPTTGGLTVQAPANANLAPPGYYMLFILKSNGVPSVANFIRFPSSLDDTQPPTPPTNLTAAGAIGSVTLSWTAATDNVGVTGYTIYRSTVSGFTPAVANQAGQAASTIYTDAVPAGTHYYLVEANDATGNFSAASNEASGTSTADTDSPTVTITNPTNGSTVSGTITVLATSTDNVVVAAVQFLLDGAALGAEVTNSPYALSWSTATATNGPHTLAATARDATGNTATSSSVTLAVNNTQPVGLVGGFGFNEGAGTTVSDASGGGNTGTIGGASWTTAGKFGNALSFNGTNSYVELSKTNAYDSLTQGTIEAWVKWNGTGYASWFSADSGNCLNPFELAVDNGKFAVWAGPSGCGATFNAYVPILNPTAWHHLAYVVSSSGNKFYIDGVQQTATYIIGSAASTFFFSSAAGGVTHYNIGRSVNNNGETFNGVIDEVRVYNRALTSAEIQNDMNTPM